MTEVAVRADTVGAFDPRNEQILTYLGLSPRDPKSAAVVAVARRYDLDPVLKHVIIIPKGGVYITRDGLLHVAHSSGQLDGIVVDQEPELSDDGREWIARVSVWRKDMGHPFTFPGRYPVAGTNKDYAQEMALKSAESHALRRAFSVAGLPAYDEQRAAQAAQAAQRQGATMAPVTAADIIGETVDEPPADPEKDRRRLFAILGELGVKEREDRLAVYSAIVGRPVASTDELDPTEVQAVADTLEGVTRYDAEHRVEEVGGLIVEGKAIRSAGAL